MKTYTTKELNANVYAYILDAINSDELYLKSDAEKLQYLANEFKSQYIFLDNIKRYGSYQNCFANWIMGLPSAFNIEYYNADILNLAKKWKTLANDATETEEQKILDNYWNFIASKTMQLFNKHKITSFYL